MNPVDAAVVLQKMAACRSSTERLTYLHKIITEPELVGRGIVRQQHTTAALYEAARRCYQAGAAPVLHAVRRVDRRLLWGEFAFIAVDGPDDWTPALEDPGWVDQLDVEMLRLHAEPVERRTLHAWERLPFLEGTL